MAKLRITYNSRMDGPGSSFMNLISIYLYAKLYNAKIYRNRNKKFQKMLIFRPLIMKSKLRLPFTPKDNLQMHTGMRGRMASPVIKSELDLVTLFKNEFKNEYYDSIKKDLNNNKQKSNIIAFHIRNDDVSSQQDYDGTPTFDYIANLINKKNFNAYDREEMLSLGKDVQAPIGVKSLNMVIADLNKKYPNKKIHFVYQGKLNKNLEDVVNNKKYTVHSNLKDEVSQSFKIHHTTDSDINEDLSILINSDVLVLSKSFFSLVAGMLHQGSAVYYPKWGSFAALGLGTKFDKSEWIPYK